MKIFFYRFSYFVRKNITQSEIVMQEPFILHRTYDLGTTVMRAGKRGVGETADKDATLSDRASARVPAGTINFSSMAF